MTDKRLALAFCAILGLLAPGPVRAPAAARTSTVSSSYFNAVSCPSPTVCVAVGAAQTDSENAAGQVTGGSYQPIAVRTTDGGRSWQAVDLPDVDANLRSVSCWSTAACVAVGGTRTVYRGRWYSVRAVVLSIRGTSASQVGDLPAGALALDAVSCPAATNCVAVGGALELGTVRLRPELLASRDGGVVWTRPALPISQGQLESVSCAPAPHCVALGASSYTQGTAATGLEDRSRPVGVWSSAPTGPWHTSAITSGQGGGPTAVSCQSLRHCLAVGDWFNWCWCGTGTPGREGYAWTTADGGATWSQTVLPVLDGYVVWYANAVSCWATDCAMGATVSTTKPGSEYYAGVQALAPSGAPTGALATSAGGLRPQYIYGLWCAASNRCVAAGQDWAHPSQAAIETETGGHWATTYTYQPAAGATYAQGAAVARRVNALALRWGSGWAMAKLGPSLIAQVRAGSSTPAFSLGFVDNLSFLSVLDLVSNITYGTQGGRAPLLDAFTTAYRTGDVARSTSADIARAHRVDTNVFDQLFLGRLRGDGPALVDLMTGLSPADVALWSASDGGYAGITPFQGAVLNVVEDNWAAYADLAAYRGPFTKVQLAAIMAAATTNDTGRQVLTDSFGSWFISHGGTPDVTGGASMPSVAHLTVWLTSLANLNAAVAAPTGQYLYSTENLVHLGMVIARMVALWGATSLVTDAIVGLISKPLIAAAVGASAAYRAWSLEEQTFSAALQAGLTTYSEARNASDYEQVVNLIEAGTKLEGHVKDVLSLRGDVGSALKKAKGYAAKVELRYYLDIVGNAFHEAVARLMQEHMIVTTDFQPHWQDMQAAVDEVTANPGGYLVVPPGASGRSVPAPPQVLEGQPAYRGIPVSFVAAVVYSQFFQPPR